MATDADRKKFLSRVRQTDGCWEWEGFIDGDGYGRHYLPSATTKRAHRISYLLFVCDPGDWLVLHKCDNRPCVRPSHLYLGTDADNVRDMIERGRARTHLGPNRPAAGERCGRSKLTWAQVRRIRALHEQGWSISRIARAFPVTEPNISAIVRGKTWKEAVFLAPDPHTNPHNGPV